MEVEIKQKLLRVTDSQFADLKLKYVEYIRCFSYPKLRHLLEDFKRFKQSLEDAYVLSSRLEDMLVLINDVHDAVKADQDAEEQECLTKRAAFIVELSKF